MNKLATFIDSLASYFTGDFRHRRATTLFIKAMFLVALFRFIRLWMVSDVFFYDSIASFPRSLIGKIVLWPAIVAIDYPDYFFFFSTVILVIGLIARPNYIINALFFWIVLSFFKVRYPATNGADFVLLVLSGLMIPLSRWPQPGSEYFSIVRTAIYNTSRVLIQIQVLTIYLISGWDKITSELWRSGIAFEYIAHLDLMFNPIFTPLLEHSSTQFVMSWATILFELFFIPLVCFERTRLPALIAGLFFHMVIWLMLGLPDFAWTMVAAYPIFMKDKDFGLIRSLWSRLFKRPGL